VPDTGTVVALLRKVDSLADIARSSRPTEQSPSGNGSARASQANSNDSAGNPRHAWQIQFRPLREFFARANDPLFLLRELKGLGAAQVTVDDGRVPLLSELDPGDSHLAWSISLETAASESRIREIFEFVEADCDLTIIERPLAETDHSAADAQPRALPPSADARNDGATRRSAPHTIRVDLERLDRLVNLVGELVINGATLAERVSTGAAHRDIALNDALEHLTALTRDLQESVMAIRAQPVKSVFQRLPRLVRELEAETGKKVELTLDGEDTEVDRSIIEGLADPLAHLIRNAVDHGIETEELRGAVGKPAAGKLSIAAAHQAGRMVIDIFDDGQGIDRDRVRCVAIERGLIAPEATLEEAELDALIFEPGFSTSSTVSHISGRGVGMDVVKKSIQSLGGRIAISSRRGVGTSISLSLPLTMAILDGMLITSYGQDLVVPLVSLIETVQLKPATVRRIGPQSEILLLPGAQVPLLDLGALLGFRDERHHGLTGIAIVVEDDKGQRLAMRVDEVLGQRQVVIKTLETNYRTVVGVSAATILGNGNVALIVDVNALDALRKPKPASTERMVVNV
jgi:two-component system chemotaxis sensor kinase CheA